MTEGSSVEGYLLDTVTVSEWFRGERVRQHIAALPEGAPLWISAITLGEIEYGHRLVADQNTEIQRQFLREIASAFPHVVCVSPNTAEPYSRLRALLFGKWAPRDKRNRVKHCWPEELRDITTAKELRIQKNDLWIAALAIEYNLVLVTHDKMTRIREAAELKPMNLRVEDWVAS
jgi:predicted nucleic acid-binding protein